MKNNKYKNKDKNEVVEESLKKGFIYLVKNQASNEMTLCAFNHQLKKSQAVIYETRYGLDLGFIVSDASKIGQPYTSGNPNPCGGSCNHSCSKTCLKTSNIDFNADSDLASSSDDIKDEIVQIDEQKITGELDKIYSNSANDLDSMDINDNTEIEDKEIFLFRDTSNTSSSCDDESNKVEVSDDTIWIERVASKEDLKRYKELCAREDDALTLCREKIKKHKLEMKLVTAHFLLIEPKVVFFFTADVRVDFRDLVKDLVSIFRIRIELRQIGVRDESRLLGGLAVCGRDYCCHSITDKLSPVSIKMAKEQNLSLNSIKISGPCGRLLCCLSYEQEFYAEEKLKYPPEGTRLKIGRDLLRVSEVNILSKKITLLGAEGRMMIIDGSRVHYNSDSEFWVLEKDYIKELLSE